MRPRSWVVALLTTLLALSVCPSGERLPVRTLTTSDGLPRDQLACVLADARGFLWFCTGDGIVRFDGERAVIFGQDSGLVPSEVRSFLITRDGKYWVGSSAGLYELETNPGQGGPRFRAVPRTDGRPSAAINAFAESRDHSVWCASTRGLLRLTQSNGVMHLREVEIGLPRTSTDVQIVRSVLEDEAGILWVGAASGLFERRPDGRIRRLTTTDGLPVDEVRALAIDADGRLWAATRQGLAWIERVGSGEPDRPVVRAVFTALDGLPATNVNSLYAEPDTLWVGTVNGIVETRMTAPPSLSVGRRVTGFYAWSIAVDRHKEVWVATESGARRLSRRGFTTYTREDGLTNTRISSVFISRSGDVCATTLVRGLELSCFDGHRFNPVPIPALRSIVNPGWGWIQLTLQDRIGRWWLPTGEGLFQFPAGPATVLQNSAVQNKYDSRSGLRSSDIFRIFEDSRGGIWISTFAETGNGLARVDPGSGALHVFYESDGLPSNLPQPHSFAEDRHGDVWIGCEFGLLLRYRAGRFDTVPIHEPRPANAHPTTVNEQLRSLLVDRRGRLWIASALSGLGRITDPRSASPQVTWFGTKQGLSNDAAWILVEHDSGDLFVGTPRGVDRFNADTGRIAHYTADDGFPRGEIWGAARDREGQLWFATTNGLARLPALADETPPPPVTVVTGVRIGGLPLSIAANGATRLDSIAVRSGDRSIEIEFVSPGAHASDGLRYQHLLEGINRDWVTTDARVVTLAVTAAGDYRFLVRALLASGTVGDPALVGFTVLAPFWQRWWFLALLGMVICSAAYGAHRYRLARALELERVRTRIAADLHDDIGSSLSRVAILSEVVKRQIGPAHASSDRLLTNIAETSRGLVGTMSDIVWSIDPTRDDLGNVIARVREFAGEMFDGRSVRWEFNAPEDAGAIALSSDQRRHLFLIFKEAVTNIARHAHCQNASIEVVVKDRTLTAAMRDDGVGLASQEIGNCRPGSSLGHGLGSMRARANALGGRLRIESTAGHGTRVFLDMPL